MIRKQSRWWVLTLLILAALITLSALALNRPNVVWEGRHAHCPSCRFAVPPFSSKCTKCATEYDWTESPEEHSPLCEYCLTAMEDGYIRDAVAKLGEPEITKRFSEAIGVSQELAKEVVGRLGRGRCGYCCGTGLALNPSSGSNASGDNTTSAVCPVCLGTTKCIACDGNRRIRLGSRAAHVALADYRRKVADVSGQLPKATQLDEYTRLAREFIERFVGTQEATEVEIPLTDEDGEIADPVRAVQAARDRLSALLESLEADEDADGDEAPSDQGDG